MFGVVAVRSGWARDSVGRSRSEAQWVGSYSSFAAPLSRMRGKANVPCLDVGGAKDVDAIETLLSAAEEF